MKAIDKNLQGVEIDIDHLGNAAARNKVDTYDGAGAMQAIDIYDSTLLSGQKIFLSYSIRPSRETKP